MSCLAPLLLAPIGFATFAHHHVVPKSPIPKYPNLRYSSFRPPVGSRIKHSKNELLPIFFTERRIGSSRKSCLLSGVAGTAGCPSLAGLPGMYGSSGNIVSPYFLEKLAVPTLTSGQYFGFGVQFVSAVVHFHDIP